MWNSYIKIAFKALGRNPFYTFVSLFGISFTLGILMVFVALHQNQFGSNPPVSDANQLVYMSRLEQGKIKIDTMMVLDTTKTKSGITIDTTYKTNERNESSSMSGFASTFIESYINLAKINSAEIISQMIIWSNYDLYKDNNNIIITAKHIDEHFFKIFDFTFIEGRSFNEADIRQSTRNIVITDQLANDYFGENVAVVGNKIKILGKDYQVIGLVKKASVNNEFINGDAFMPLTEEDRTLEENGYFGNLAVVIKSKNTQTTINELEYLAKQIPMKNGDFNYLKFPALTHEQFISERIAFDKDPQKGVQKAQLLFILLVILFCVVPFINLIQLTINRIVERQNEIGVRKTFGAVNFNIFSQIIFENILFTFIGSVFAFFIAQLLIYMINSNKIFMDILISFNGTVFLYFILITLLFGIIIGLLPARKISKASIVQSLKHK